jgi:hypothetical protein
MRTILWNSTRLALAIMGAAALTACSLSAADREPPPPLYVFKYQQLWLTPDEREMAQCWDGGPLICSDGIGRLSELLCECPLNELYR